MTARRYHEGITAVGCPCWCQTQILDGRVMATEVDGVEHTRGWCRRVEVTA
jgi:hypothetical protein